MIDRLKRFRRWINRYNFKEIFMGIHILGVKWFVRSIRAIYEGNELHFDEQILYDKWLMHNDNYNEAVVRRAISEMNRKPLISILIPVYNVEPRWLIKCVHSIESQSYPNWEICLADDCSTQENVRATLKKLEASDRRIKVVYRAENGHISKATN
ncbi:MAG TPA: glycosyltransferase, partial [Clostridiaceae bacterium]|nr:glycosyltransferase [Clostridiaceae bacterium]